MDCSLFSESGPIKTPARCGPRRGVRTDQSELLHFDGSGVLLGRFVPTETREHGFNELVIGGQGDILLTDSVTNEIFRFDSLSHVFQILKGYRPLSAPN